MTTSFNTTITLICFLFLGFACNKNDDATPSDTDKTNPVISLKGDADLSVGKGSNTPDPGATASDNVDGDLSASVTSNWNTAVDQSNNGSYTVTYSVSDKAGNIGTATRKVTVKAMAGSLLGVYKSSLTTPYGTGAMLDATVTIGSNPSQIIVYPFYIAYYLHADLKGLFNEELSFDYNDQGANFKGSGTITNGGKNLTFTGNITTATSAQSFTANLWKD